MELRLIALGDGYISLQEPAPPENTSELRLFLWAVVLCHRSSPLRAGKNSGPDEPPLGLSTIAPPTTTSSDLDTAPVQRIHSTQVRLVFSALLVESVCN